MKFQNVDHIITAKHMSKTGNARDWITQCLDDIYKSKGVRIAVIEETDGTPLLARVHRGHWICDCEVCNGAMVVDPDYPVFFCCTCFNRNNRGRLRPVIFPEESERLLLEQELLRRPVNDVAGVTDSDRAANARAVLYKRMKDGTELPMLREWLPYESLEVIREQNKLVETWEKEIKQKGK